MLTPTTASMPAKQVIQREPEIWAAAKALEANFLATMLQSAGLGEARDAFGGGVGETQFTSMLADEQAKQLTNAGGIGLAESIYESLVRSKGQDAAR